MHVSGMLVKQITNMKCKVEEENNLTDIGERLTYLAGDTLIMDIINHLGTHILKSTLNMQTIAHGHPRPNTE